MEEETDEREGTVERVVLRVALEAYPLREASIPACRFRSIALFRGTKGGHRLLYLGTDTGQLLLFTISTASTSNAHSDAAQPQLPPVKDPASGFSFPSLQQPALASSWSGWSPGRASDPAFDSARVRTARTRAASNSALSAGAFTGAGDGSASAYSPSPSPPLSAAPSQDDDRDEGLGYGHLSASSPLYLSDVEDSKSRAGEPEYIMKLRAHKSLGSRSPVESICVLSEAGRVAVLWDGVVALLSNTLDSLEVLGATKGASAMARGYPRETDSQTSLPAGQTGAFAAQEQGGGSEDVFESLHTDGQSVGRRSTQARSISSKFGEIRGVFGFSKPGQLGSGGNAGMTGRTGRERASGRLVVAVKKKLLLYKVYPVRNGMKENSSARLVKEMVGLEGVVTLAWVGNVIFAASLREYTLFSVSSGQALFSMALPQDPLRPPLLKPIPQDYEVLLMLDYLGTVVNTKGEPRSGSVVFKSVPDSLALSTPYLAAATNGQVELYHRKTCKKIQTVLTDAADGPSLIVDDDDGSFLVVASGAKVWCLQQVSVDDQAKDLLKQKEYNEAVQLAKECLENSGGSGAVARLGVVHVEAGFLLLFDLFFEEAINHFLESDLLQPFELFRFFPAETTRWRSVIPRKRYWGLHPPPQPIETVIKNALQERRGVYGQDVNVKDTDFSAKQEEFLLLAVKHFARYLSSVRGRMMSGEEKEGVDTLLMKLYIKLGSSIELRQLASSENSCILGEVEGLLDCSPRSLDHEYSKLELELLHVLALLYENKGLTVSALQVWQRLAQWKRAPVRSSADSVSEGIISRREAASQAAQLLEVADDSDLVLHHMPWILELSGDLAFRVFTSTRRNKVLPSERVLKLLHVEDGSILRRYLQWLVLDQGSEEPYHHTQLALSLAGAALSEPSTRSGVSHRDESTVSKVVVRDDVHHRNGKILEANGLKLGAQSSQSTRNDSDRSTGSAVASDHSTAYFRETLQLFLVSSDIYSADVVLTKIQGSELWREQVFLHQRLGDVMSALRILALKLEDFEAAERYCEELGRPDVYMQLLEMYFQPGPRKERMHSAALRLLHHHGLVLDPLHVLEVLPSNMPLSAAYGTIACLLRERVHRHVQGQLARHLVRAGNLEARVQKVEGLTQCVQITVDSTCGSCNARIGTKPFARYPDNSIVCYKCLRGNGMR